MSLIWRERLSDSPLIDSVWSSETLADGTHTMIADGGVNIVVVKTDGNMQYYLYGPTTSACTISYKAGAETIGIRLKLGVHVMGFAADTLLNNQRILPAIGSQSFAIHGHIVQFPSFDDAEASVHTLWKLGLLGEDAMIQGLIHGQQQDASLRTLQRHFKKFIGIAPHRMIQIQRAHYAMSLLRQGAPATTVAFEAGFTDQSHMITSLKHYLGRTPLQIKSIPQLV